MVQEFDIAVIIPCHNEAVSIGKVVEWFWYVLPTAKLHAYDSNSKDNTPEVALKTGAIMREDRLITYLNKGL